MILQAQKGTELECELSILARDTHSPSGLLIQNALNIFVTVNVGYGTTYQISSGECGPGMAVEAYRELTNRAPALLTALLDMANSKHKKLEVRIGSQLARDKSVLSSHEKIAAIPLLVAWLAA